MTDQAKGIQAIRMRLGGMMRKECLQILRDPSSLAIAFILPLVLLLLFGYGVSLDARQIPLALVVEQPDAQTAGLTSSFEHSEYFAPAHFSNIHEAQQALLAHQVDGIPWLRNNFSCCLLSGGNAGIGVIVNGVNANQARIIEGYLQGVWQTWLQNQANAEGRDLSLPVTEEHRIWFNPSMRSQDFIIPGLIAVIMTLIGALLTAMVVAREWVRGTMAALMVTPIRMWEILIGKLIPYFVLGMGGMLLTVAMARWQFDVPLRGSFWALLGSSALFMLVALGMGLLISILAKSQFVAGQVAIIVTFLPAFILSGFIFDITSMPAAVQAITHLVPARYFVTILQTLFLAGDIWRLVLANATALLLISLIFLILIKHKAHKRLD